MRGEGRQENGDERTVRMLLSKAKEDASRNAVGGIAVPQSIFLSLAEEAFMRGTNWGKAVVGISAMVCALLTGAEAVRGQSAGEGDSGGAGAAHDSLQPLDLATVGSLLKQLQAQVQELNTQVKELKTQQKSEQAEAAELRRELDATKSRLVAMSGPGNSGAAAQVLPGSPMQTAPASTSTPALRRRPAFRPWSGPPTRPTCRPSPALPSSVRRPTIRTVSPR